MQNKLIFSLLILLVSLLTGCSILSPVSAPQTNTYLLQFNNCYSLTKQNSSATTNLLVSDPTIPAWLNTTNMAYQLQTSQVNYFSKNVWADTPSHMLQNNIVASLEQSGHFHAVVAEPFSGSYDKRLDIRILNFSQDFTQKPSVFRLQILAILVNGQTQQVIASQIINEDVVSPSDSPIGGVAAANIAVARLNNALLMFTLRSPHPPSP